MSLRFVSECIMGKITKYKLCMTTFRINFSHRKRSENDKEFSVLFIASKLHTYTFYSHTFGMAELPPPSIEEIQRSCSILCLDVPEGTQMGLDYYEWTCGPKFKGIKLIPPGVHFLYYRFVMFLL